MPPQQFQGYSQDQMKRVASKLGHTGDLPSFGGYLQANPPAMNKYNALINATTKRYASGGVVKSGYDAGGDVQAAYMANFGREPQPDALAFYVNALNTGTKSLEQINADLAYVDEGKAYKASLAAKEQVRQPVDGGTDYWGDSRVKIPEDYSVEPLVQAYIDATGRRPNKSGYNFYKNQIANGTKTLEDIKADLAYSDEGKQYQVTKDNESIQNLFKDKLGRYAGKTGQEFYAGKVAELKASGKTSEEALATIGLELDGSTEGKQRLANPDQQRYVAEDDRVYGQAHDMQDREGGNNRRYTQAGPDYATTDQAVDKLGRTGDNTAADVAAIQSIYQGQTGRAGDSAGVKYYSDLLAGGTGLDTIRGQINDSTEGVGFDATGQQKFVDPVDQIKGVTYRPDPSLVTTPPPVTGPPEGIPFTKDSTLGDISIGQQLNPTLPTGTKTVATATQVNPNQLINKTAGQVGAAPTASTTQAAYTKADTPDAKTHTDITTSTAESGVKGVTDALVSEVGTVTDTVQAQQGAITERADGVTSTAGQVGATTDLAFTAGQKVNAATGEIASSANQLSNKDFTATTTSLDSATPEAQAADAYNLKTTQSAQMGDYTIMDPAKAGTVPHADIVKSDATSGVVAQNRAVSNQELVDVAALQLDEPVAAVAATMNALNTEATMIAQQGNFSQSLATDRQGAVSAASTMQGQMASLMEQFNDGTPAWAAGAMRNANAVMAARGIGASSMASAAIVQAAMESAMPIAQNDAQAFLNMDMANLNNRQQTSLANAAAQQNMDLNNLSNKQQSALQNSTNAFALQAESLSNLQAVVISNQSVKAAAKGMNLNAETQTSLANAARYAEVNNINLNNAQQSNLAKSAENLSIDLTNLSTEQATSVANLQVRASLKGQDVSNEQQMAVLESTKSFESAQFDATSQQAAFMQDAIASAAMKSQVLSNEQQTALFNVSSQLSERELELTSEQQTKLFNTTNAMQMEVTNLSNKQQTALANAQIDASIKGQELSNRQQTNVLNASRVSEIANMNFTAEQNKAIQNSNLVQTMDLANLSNKQAAQLANVANSANMDMANLNNRQQAEVNNAQAFLEVDMANLSNAQQTTMFAAQERISSILSDKAAENATKQFNASSTNQVDQFYDNMTSTMNQFNSSQKNAQDKFNAGEINATEKFNTEIKNQRDQFNATNSLVVEQSNAQWRRTVATADTAATNRANEINAKAALDISNTAYDNLWQEHRDEMDWGYQIKENEADRFNSLAQSTIAAEAEIAKAEGKDGSSMWENVFKIGATYAEYKAGQTAETE